MQRAANVPNTNRFFIDVFSFRRWAELHKGISPGEFYQLLTSEIIKGVRTKEALSQIANGLVNLADHVYITRQMDTLEQISQILLNLPLAREFRSIARYYQGFCVKRKGEFDGAVALFERVAEEAPVKYRARAIIALGSAAFDRGDFQSAMSFYIEAGKAVFHRQGFDPLAAFYTQHMLAVLKSIDGDNQGALADLDRMFPLARAVGSTYPPIYYNYVNSRAIELAEVGRLEEAARTCRITLVPAFANAYPEVRETWDDIQMKRRRASRSFVSFAQPALKSENVVHLPAPDHSTSLADAFLGQTQQPARVLDYLNWKKNMVKQPNDTPLSPLTREQILKLSRSEKRVRVVDLVYEDDVSEETLAKILEVAEDMVRKDKDKNSS